MSGKTEIVTLNRNEVDTMYQWITREGWNPGRHDANTFHKAFPKGLIGIKLDDELAGVSAVFRHNARYASFGNYIVKPEYRGLGLGLQMTRRRLQMAGYRNLSLDGVIEKEAMYRSVGFRTSHINQRFCFEWKYSPEELCSRLIDLKHVTLLELLDYEKHLFPGKRKAYLKAWVTQPDTSAFCFKDHHDIKGFGVIRPCIEGYKIGPLFADTPVIAEHLMQALLQHSSGQPTYCDMPELNINTRHLVHSFGGQPVDFLCARMYRGYQPDLDHQRIYALTSLEAG